MKRIVLSGAAASFVAAAVVGVVMAAGVSRTSAETGLTIRHATVGCHELGVRGGSFGTAQSLVLRQGHSFTVTNRDNTGHVLVQTGGPSEVLAGSTTLEPLGTPVRVALHVPGLYTFMTQENEGSMYGTTDAEQHFGFGKLASTGVDNVLTLNVRVVPDRTPIE